MVWLDLIIFLAQYSFFAFFVNYCLQFGDRPIIPHNYLIQVSPEDPSELILSMTLDDEPVTLWSKHSFNDLAKTYFVYMLFNVSNPSFGIKISLMIQTLSNYPLENRFD